MDIIYFLLLIAVAVTSFLVGLAIIDAAERLGEARRYRRLKGMDHE